MSQQETQTLKRFEDENSWRWYGIDSPKYISVTKAMDHIVHEKLLSWMKAKSENFQKKTLTAAGDFGTAIHKIVEDDAKGLPAQVSEEHWPVYKNWITFKQEHGLKLIKSEQMVCSDRFGYAGTLDLICEYKGKLCVGDIKTGRYNIKTGWQMAAYHNAYLEMNPDIKELGMVGLSLPRDGSAPKLFEYAHIDECFTAFIASLETFKMLYFNQLKKIGWPYLETKFLEVVK